jgi:restriction system protein
MVRPGPHGEHEKRFFTEGRIYLTWDELPNDLHALKDNRGIREALRASGSTAPPGRIAAWTGQIARFLLKMKPGDAVAVPLRTKAAIALGEITGPYLYDAKAEMPYRHFREVRWLNLDTPRSRFMAEQDLRYALNVPTTISQVGAQDGEARARRLAGGGPPPPREPQNGATVVEDETPSLDLERLGRDQIANFIIRKFKGHDMARLVEALLRAQGYTTFKSPPGPDKGVDILASPGPLGFARPRICVQVKALDSAVEHRVLNELRGAMQAVKADQGLLVSWGGFTGAIDRDRAQHFFDVRLWDQDDLIEQLLEQYERLDADLRAELPLKRIWTVAAEEPEE